jgi:hypothetical protein
MQTDAAGQPHTARTRQSCTTTQVGVNHAVMSVLVTHRAGAVVRRVSRMLDAPQSVRTEQVVLSMNIGTIRVTVLQPAREHALTCAAAIGTASFGTYPAQSPGQGRASDLRRSMMAAASGWQPSDRSAVV